MNATAIITGIVCASVGFWAGAWFRRDERSDEVASLRDSLRHANAEIRIGDGEIAKLEDRVLRQRFVIEQAKQTCGEFIAGLDALEAERESK